MSQQEKPREFWIYDINTRGEGGFTKRVITDNPKEHMGKDSSFIMYHVIEKSAFDSLKEENARLREVLRISADKHEGMALCLEAHGTNLNIPFLINDCRADAARDRKALAGGQDGKG